MKKTPIFGTCPHCYAEARCATDYEGDRTPQSGDFILCQGCGEWSVYIARGRQCLRRPTPKERLEIADNSGAKRLRERYNAKGMVLQ